jgi:DNA invertase Pin-like site-specific DNA recombinase
MARGRPQSIAAAALGENGGTVWRIAVYIRLSKEDGNDESESVVNQKKIITEYLERFFDGQFTVADFYIDDGLTGTDDARLDFMRMVQDIEQGRVNCMICKTLSRAFRNYADQGYYLEEYFQQKNVRFICMGDPKVDTFTNPEAIYGLDVPMTGVMNDRFAAQTSNAVRRTFATKRRNGEFIGAFAPYGYLKDPNDRNRLIIDPEIAELKRAMFRWIVDEGLSLRGVALKLNELGVLNPTAYKRSKGMKYANPNAQVNDGLWTGTTVRHTLLDKMNLGHMVQGRQRVVSYKVHDKVRVAEEDWFIKENTHEAIFTQEEYDTLMNIVKRDTRTANDSRTVHLFSGFMKCADCRKALQRKAARNTVYYACRTYAEKSKVKCTKHSIREDLLIKGVLSAVKAHISFAQGLAELVDEINAAPDLDVSNKRLEKMLVDKQKELAKLKSLSDGLYMDWKSGEITHDDYRRMKARFEQQKAQLEASISKLEEERRRLGQGVGGNQAVFEAFLKYKSIDALDRTILIELVDAIYVHEGKEITIEFCFKDELERVLEGCDKLQLGGDSFF